MDKLSIKIHVANRIYPMKIERDSEEYVRNAVKKIEARLKFYEDNYAIKDKQDLLAMCLIEYGSKLENVSTKEVIQNNGINERLVALDEELFRLWAHPRYFNFLGDYEIRNGRSHSWLFFETVEF